MWEYVNTSDKDLPVPGTFSCIFFFWQSKSTNWSIAQHTFLDAYYVVQAMFTDVTGNSRFKGKRKIFEKLCCSKNSILKRSPIATSPTEDLFCCLDFLHKIKYQPYLRNGKWFFAYLVKVWTKQLKSSIDCSTVSGKVWTWSSSILLLSLLSISGVYLTCIYVRISSYTYTDQRKMTAKIGVPNCKMKIK